MNDKNWLDIFLMDENRIPQRAMQIGSDSSSENTRSVFDAMEANAVLLADADYRIDLVSKFEGIISCIFVNKKTLQEIVDVNTLK